MSLEKEHIHLLQDSTSFYAWPIHDFIAVIMKGIYWLHSHISHFRLISPPFSSTAPTEANGGAAWVNNTELTPLQTVENHFKLVSEQGHSKYSKIQTGWLRDKEMTVRPLSAPTGFATFLPPCTSCQGFSCLGLKSALTWHSCVTLNYTAVKTAKPRESCKKLCPGPLPYSSGAVCKLRTLP